MFDDCDCKFFEIIEKYVPKSPGSISDHCRSPLLGRDQDGRGGGDAEQSITKSGSRESPSSNVPSSNGKSLISSNFTFPW